MSAFVYSRDGTLNAVVNLFDLELAVSLLSNPGMALHKQYQRWHRLSEAIAGAIASHGTVHILLHDAAPSNRPMNWRVRLQAAPEPLRGRVREALMFIVGRHGVTLDESTVELM